MTTKVITLCGSTRFARAFVEWNARLTIEEGACVFSCAFFKPRGSAEWSVEHKCRLDAVHMMKIDRSDEIFVLDAGGYVGESTQREIEYAQLRGTRIRRLSDEHPSWTETDCIWATEDV